VEAAAPLGDGVGVTAEFGGDVVVAGLVGLSATQDEACPEGQGLGGGTGVDQALQVLGFLRGESQDGGFPSHDQTSWSRGESIISL
jgi:hypothetical protein